MKFELIRPNDEILTPGSRVVSRSWFQWFRELAGNLGFDRSVAVYDRLHFPARLLDDTGATLSRAAIDGNLTGVGFPHSSDEYVQIEGRLPNNYRDGSDVVPYLVWAPSNTNTDDCLWSFEYAFAADGSLFSATSETKADAGGGTAGAGQLVEFTTITGTALRKGDNVLMRFGRVGADGDDTFSGVAILLGVGLAYPVESIGEKARHP